MSFLELQRASDEALAWGRRYYSKGGFLADMDDRVIEVIADSLGDAPLPELEVYCLQLGGAVSDVDEDATAYSGRAAAFYWISQGVWDDPHDDEAAIAWCRRTARRLGELSMSANYVNEQADTGIAHSAYGESKYRRLADLKWRYDPTNLFHLNQNIQPMPA
jgi:FAD/FMN-containing dehydrogenase